VMDFFRADRSGERLGFINEGIRWQEKSSTGSPAKCVFGDATAYTRGARLSNADRRSWLITLSLHDVRDRAGRVLGSSLVQRVTMLYST
jgi:hypothetical protein